MSSLDSFQEIIFSLFGRNRGGGRRPEESNQDALDDPTSQTWLQATPEDQARLTIVQITDVYTLDNFASLKTMLQEIREKQGPNANVISMLTGDFLSPYLLSSIDNGNGMMMAINDTPIDYLTWGNHEADIPHKYVCKHVKNYKGTFINSNMQSHESMKYDCSVPYEVIEVTSPDGSHTHRIGLVALLSNDPKLYSHFKEPAFGGATIEDPWETLEHYKRILEEEHGCDLVVPLEHMYVPENQKTTEIYKDCGTIPLILSGHDHHRIDQVINNTRLIKPGMDGVTAAVIEIIFDKNDYSKKPKIRSSFVETSMFEPCPELKAKTDAAYDVLLPLRNTMLASVLPQFLPLTSKNARGSVCTMGKLICSMLKESLRQSYHAKEDDDGSSSGSEDDEDRNPFLSNKKKKKIDAVILMGGNIRGNEDYPDDAFFSLETLEAEIKPDEVLGFVDMPGHVMAAGIEFTHSGDPRPGWFQYDDGITQDPQTKKVLTVGGKPLEPNRVYRVATKIKDLTNGQSPPLKAYYEEHPELLPSKGQYINIHSQLMSFFARGMFRKLWDATTELIPDPEVVAEDHSHPVNMDRIEGKLRISVLDQDNDGFVSVDDIHVGLRDFLGLSVDDNYKHLARQVHACADITGNGKVSVEDFEIFCRDGMPPELALSTQWEEAFPDPLPDLSPEITDATGQDSFTFTPLSKQNKGESMATFESSTRDSSPLPSEFTVHAIEDY